MYAVVAGAAAGVHLDQPISGDRPDSLAPDWLRPLCLQRWVGQAVTARLAWLHAHPDLAALRYERESRPRWDVGRWDRAERRCLRDLCEETLLRLFVIEVERLLRILREPPGLVGNADWARATLAACEHVAQVYHELRRRHNAVRARYLLREELRHYVTWQPDRAALGYARAVAPTV